MPPRISIVPENVSMRVAAAADASVNVMDCDNCSKFAEPISANANAARMASVPNMVLTALLRCSSDNPESAVCSRPEISAMLRISPVAVKN